MVEIVIVKDMTGEGDQSKWEKERGFGRLVGGVCGCFFEKSWVRTSFED